MFIKSMFHKARLEEAEANWQATHGAARQQSLAALFMTSAREALQNYRQEIKASGKLPDNYIARCRQAIHLAGRDFKRAHFQEVHLIDHKYWVSVQVTGLSWYMPMSFHLYQSKDMELLSQGVADVRIHSPDSPYYQACPRAWDKHVAQADKDRRRYFLF